MDITLLTRRVATFNWPSVLSTMDLIFLEFMCNLTLAAVCSALYSIISASLGFPDSTAKALAKYHLVYH